MGGIIKDISVWVVDDHHDFRDTVRELLDSQPDMICTAALASCERLLSQIDSLPKADVVLMDINFKGRMSGTEGIRELRKILPNLQVLVLSMYSEEDLIFDALCNGASGYLSKMGNPERIIDGIRTIARKEMLPMSSTIAARIIDLFQDPHITPPLEETELELLEYIKQGRSLSQLSDLMDVDPSTLDAYLLQIYRKLHRASTH